MSAAEVPVSSPSEAAFLDWLEQVRLSAARLAGRAATHPLTAACGEAMADWLGEPYMQAPLWDLFEADSALAPDEAQRKVRAAAQFQLQSQAGFPNAYTTKEVWRQGLEAVDAQVLGAHIVERDLGTSISQRYVLAAFLLSVLRHRLPARDLRVVDVGCSDMAGGTRLVLANEIPGFGFDPVEVVELMPARGVVSMPSKGPRFDTAAAAAPPIGLLVGVDRVNPVGQDAARWLRAFLLPDEIAAGRAEQNDAFVASGAHDPRLRFVHADVTERRGQQAVRAALGRCRMQKADAVLAIASLREGSAQEREAKYRYMEGFGRLAIIADFIDQEDDHLEPEATWTVMNVFVIYRSQIYKVMRFTDGRCRQVEILPQLSELAEGGPYERTVAGLVSRRAISQATMLQAVRSPAGNSVP